MILPNASYIILHTYSLPYKPTQKAPNGKRFAAEPAEVPDAASQFAAAAAAGRSFAREAPGSGALGSRWE